MGNRAVVQFIHKGKPIQAFYLHYNGGPESVYTFLSILMNDYECRSDAAPARFAQLVGNFFGRSLSLYPWENGEAMTEDNGIYMVDTQEQPWGIMRAVPLATCHAPADLQAMRVLTVEEVLAEQAAAVIHPYNLGNKLREEIRQSNDVFFLANR